MDKLIVLNHKMNLLSEDTYEYLNKINQLETNANLIICPSNIYLETFINNTNWAIGSQNVSNYLEGSYTGEISTNQLKSLGIEYSIIGHYERRKYQHETTKETKQKLEACLEGNIMPILCFGEDNPDDAYKYVEDFLEEVLANIANIEFITFAYEPSWLIDTNEYCDTEEVEHIINYIYEILKEKYHTKPVIIFGGNVNEENINQILAIEKLSGVMIGKDSANINKIKNLLEIVDKKEIDE